MYGGKKMISEIDITKHPKSGTFCTKQQISKNELFVDYTYQRERLDEARITHIAKTFNWELFGAIIVADRGADKLIGQRYAILDGGGRLIAARMRADINNLPCLVFPVTNKEHEARVFAELNIIRTNISGIQKYKASLVYKNQTSIDIQKIFDAYGVKVGKAKSPMSCEAMNVCIVQCSLSKEDFSETISILSIICRDYPITQYLLKTIFYLLRNVEGLDIPERHIKFRERIIKVGATQFQISARNLATAQLKGDRYMAEAALSLINRNLKKENTFDLKPITDKIKNIPVDRGIRERNDRHSKFLPSNKSIINITQPPSQNTSRWSVGKEPDLEIVRLCG
jgi:hypothetical protein